MSDTITRVIPQDGWSPIICRHVPIQQTITNIVGDKGANEIWLGGKIKNFHAKIDWQDQYSGSRVPADIISESSDDYGETWTMNEVEEHEEGSFELDYEGHERDFEVRLNGTSLYIRYRWLMNGQEITDASGSLEHTITVTDYPVKLEVKAHYADNFGGHEIGANTFESATVFYKSGAIASKTAGQLTKPTQTGANAAKWADKDGWQSQTWSYSENGVTVTAQVGANITALRDVAIDVELNPLYSWSHEDGKDYWCKAPSSNGVTFTRVGELDGGIILKTNITTIPDDVTPEVDDFYNIYFGSGDEDYYSIAKGSIIKGLLGVTENIEEEAFYFGAVEELIEYSGIEEGNVDFFWDSGLTTPIIVGSTNPTIIFREGHVVSKSELQVTMTRNDGTTYPTLDYWMPNNYALGKNNQKVTVQRNSLSKSLPLTVAYSTKVEVGNVDEESEEFLKSSFYEYGEYVAPTHYKAYYECYDGTEGFDEVEEIDGQWNKRFVDGIKFLSTAPSKIEGGVYFYKTDYIPSEGVQEYYGTFGESWSVDVHTSESISSDTIEIGTIDYWEYSHYNAFTHLEHGPIYILSDTPIDSNKVEGYLLTYEGDTWEKITLNIIGSPFIEGTFYYDAEFNSSHYNCSLVNSDGDYVGEISNGELCLYSDIRYIDINNIFFFSFESGILENLPEYGSEAGTLTLGSKKYLYRVGLEPIDEENYLFIKDFKNEPFNYGLVGCYEPQWEEGDDNPDIVYLGFDNTDGPHYMYRVPSPPDGAITDEMGLRTANLIVARPEGLESALVTEINEVLLPYFSAVIDVSLGDWVTASTHELDLDHLDLTYQMKDGTYFTIYSKGIDL